jgi:hypothetical protein
VVEIAVLTVLAVVVGVTDLPTRAETSPISPDTQWYTKRDDPRDRAAIVGCNEFDQRAQPVS